MQTLKKWLFAALSALQAVVFAAPFVLNYFGSHRMGAHRHLKVRADQYFGGILNNRNLTIAAVVVSVLLGLLIWYLVMQKRAPREKLLRVTWFELGLTAALLALLVIPPARTILIYPWMLLCLAVLWLLQLAKILLLQRRSRTNDDPSKQN